MYMDRVYVQQNDVDNVYNLGLIIFRDQVSEILIPFQGQTDFICGHLCVLMIVIYVMKT